MIRSVRWSAVLLACVPHLLPGQATGGSAPQQEVGFTFERAVPGVAVPRYSIALHADGSGTYHAELAPTGNQPETRMVDRTLQFAPATLKGVFEGLRLLRSAHGPCDAHLKNIADTGKKTLIYRDAAGEGSCSFNYSENRGAVQLTDLFQSMEATLEAGRALDFKHRFDRLGLDAEMTALAGNVESGRATAVEIIATTLRSIAEDTELIERVRLRAAKLLERAGAGP